MAQVNALGHHLHCKSASMITGYSGYHACFAMTCSRLQLGCTTDSWPTRLTSWKPVPRTLLTSGTKAESKSALHELG